MIVGCPSCQTKFRLDDEKVVTEIRLRCTKCRTIFRVVKRAAAIAPVQAPSPPAVSRTSVFVAHESPSFCAAVQKVLSHEPFDVRPFNDGLQVLEAVRGERPAVVLLDVALPSMFGFEVCENIRADGDLSGVKIILIASIYDKTRYKRMPTSLYGADDYVEKHHIPDELAAKIYRLTAGQQPVEQGAPEEKPDGQAITEPAADSAGELMEQQEQREELRQMEEQETTAPPPHAPQDLSEGHVKARRFARIIVSDIALYNQAKVEEGVRNGTFFDLIADDIREGRSIYVQRVAEEVREGTSYLEDALAELIEKKKRELNI
jgi:predicted Zn finger-like uncharacterized protein